MAKVKYKIEEVKKDKTIAFRVPNQFYELLKKLSLKSDQSINTFTRKMLTDYLYSRYPEDEEDLKILYKELSGLEKEHTKNFDEGDRLQNKITIHTATIEELERHQNIQNKLRIDIDNRIKFIENKIRQLEEIQGKDDLIKQLNKFKKTEVWKVPKKRGSLEKHG